ncbi:MAG: Flp pilus assembly protein TadD [Limisphaerales bacterium]
MFEQSIAQAYSQSMNTHGRIFVLMALAVLNLGCANNFPPLTSSVQRLDLFDGAEIFGHTVEAAPVSDVLSLSPEMEAFLADTVSRRDVEYARFRKLMGGLVLGGFFANNYQFDGTYSAAETFAQRKGNCLGYTNMFIALAREVGLDARYQLIESHPVWNVESGYLIKNNHINVLVEGVRMPHLASSEVIVDFNMVTPNADDTRPKLVSDAYATSLLHANLGVSYLHEGKLEQAFAELKRAAQLAPENKTVWNNLGVLLSKLQRPSLAQLAYEEVVRIDRHDKTAWVGLTVALTAQGRLEEAARYGKKVERYQRRNPYYHFALAEAAFGKHDYPGALGFVEAAINLRKSDADFYSLRAATAEQLGDGQLASRSNLLAKKYRNRSHNNRRVSSAASLGTLLPD